MWFGFLWCLNVGELICDYDHKLNWLNNIHDITQYDRYCLISIPISYRFTTTPLS